LRNSNGRLAIDHSLFENMMAKLAIDRRFSIVAAHFRYKHAENDFAHPPCFFQSLTCSAKGGNLSGFGKSSVMTVAVLGHILTCVECFFALRCPGIRSADDSIKWSLRQVAVYQKFDAAQQQTRWNFLGISFSKSELGELIQEQLQRFKQHEAQGFHLHLTVLEYVVSCWKAYLADLYVTVEDNVGCVSKRRPHL
jgi:hypothetical protein